MSYQCSPFSKSTGTGKLGQSSGASLALFAGIFIACAFTVRGEDPVPEEPLPSSTDIRRSADRRCSCHQLHLAGSARGTWRSEVRLYLHQEVTSTQPRRFHYRFGLTVRGVYDDNIFLTNTNKVDDWYFAIEPMLTVGWGDIEGQSRELPSPGLYPEYYSLRRPLGRECRQSSHPHRGWLSVWPFNADSESGGV